MSLVGEMWNSWTIWWVSSSNKFWKANLGKEVELEEEEDLEEVWMHL